MNDQDPEKPSLIDRVKPHIPALCIGVVAGALITKKLTPIVTNLISPGWTTGDVWFSEATKQRLIERGSATIEFKSGAFVELIDWTHPSNAKK
jgi:hypothetical protein